MADTMKTVKKAAGIAIPTGVLIAMAVGIFGTNIVAWPGSVDKQMNVLNAQTISIAKDVEVLEKFDIDQIKVNEKVERKLDEMVKAQNIMNIEQAKQGVTLLNISVTLKRMEDNR